jgi:hypothetical protein
MAKKPKRDDRYINNYGLVAQLIVPMMVGEDDDGDSPAEFSWGAFLIVGDSRVGQVEPPWTEMHQTPTRDSQEEAAEQGDLMLKKLGFTRC